jgi:integrase
MARPRRVPEGIRVRHSRSCSSREGGRCDCTPSFEASAYARRDGKKVRCTFATITEAKRWRTAMLKLSHEGGLRAPGATTLDEAAGIWLDSAERGAIRTRPSSIRNTVNALRAIYRSSDLLTDGTVAANPTIGLRLPAVRGKPDRIAPPDEASRLLAALPAGDRAVWATALYAGLRAGELRALAWEQVDLGGGTIRVVRSYDPKAGFVEPKSRAGVRRVPIASVLREQLIQHRLLTGRQTGLERSVRPVVLSKLWMTIHGVQKLCISAISPSARRRDAPDCVPGGIRR